jgi:hypothetical protein
MGCRWSKQARHKTGLPWRGRNGTVVPTPHPAQFICVSGRVFLPFEFALHCLQCLGSLTNFLCSKKICSPTVNVNSFLQETQISSRSVERSCKMLPARRVSLGVRWWHGPPRGRLGKRIYSHRRRMSLQKYGQCCSHNSCSDSGNACARFLPAEFSLLEFRVNLVLRSLAEGLGPST